MESLRNFVLTDFKILHLVILVFTIVVWSIVFRLVKRLRKSYQPYYMALAIYLIIYMFPYALTLLFGDIFFLIVYFSFFFIVIPVLFLSGVLLISYLLIGLARERNRNNNIS